MLFRIARPVRRVSVMIGAIVACLTPPTFAADYEFKPFLTISEEVTDNIYQDSLNKRTEYITRLQPGFTSIYKGPYWNWDAVYTFDYRNYARKSNDNEFTHNASLKGNIAVLKNFFYLDVVDVYHRVSVDVARDTAIQPSLFLNQTDQNIATVSPYLSWRLGEKSTLNTGYRYVDTRYWGEGIEKREHSAFADFSHELTSKFSLSAGYGFTRSDSISDRFDTHNIYGGFKYQYADKSTIYAQMGNNWQKFSSGENVTFYSWNAGIIQDLDIAVATLETSSQTTTDPLTVSTTVSSYSAKLDKVLKRGNVGLSSTYSEYVNSKNNVNNQRKLAIGGFGRYEVMSSLTPNISVTFEHFFKRISTGNTGTNFPNHLSVTAGLSYAFNHELTLSLNYMYDIYANDLYDATGANKINRVVVELKKVF